MSVGNGVGNTAVRTRVLAPDLARGAMLLLIVVAHAPLYLVGVESGILSHPSGGSVLDQIMRVMSLLIADNRAYPMFAALLGYGMVMIITREQNRDEGTRPGARSLLRRRGWWLIVFGLVHGLLVTPIEILGAYGVAILVVGWMFFRTERTMLIGAAVLSVWFVVAIVASSAVQNLQGGESDSGWEDFSAGEMAYGMVDLIERIIVWVTGVITTNLTFPIIVAMLIGGWAARRRILEEPQRHLRLLSGAAIVGILVAFAGAMPLVLLELGRLPAELGWVAQSLHVISGVFGGLAYTALFGLLGARLQHRRGPAVGMLAAAGQRSLTCYLFQSFLLVMMLSQSFLGLGSKVHSAGAMLVAIVAWCGGILLAALLERAGRAGPAETLLRRLVYRR